MILLRSRNVYQGTKAKKYADVLTVLLKIFKRGVQGCLPMPIWKKMIWQVWQ
jgi:hypothetical protein